VPRVGDWRGARQQRLNLVQVIDKVIGDPPQRLVRRPRVRHAVLVEPGDRPPIPAMPRARQRKARLYRIGDRFRRVASHALMLAQACLA